MDETEQRTVGDASLREPAGRRYQGARDGEQDAGGTYAASTVWPEGQCRFGGRRRARIWAKGEVRSYRSGRSGSRDRDSDGDGAYRLLGSLTTASQLTSKMLAETRRTSKRLSRGHIVAVRRADA